MGYQFNDFIFTFLFVYPTNCLAFGSWLGKSTNTGSHFYQTIFNIGSPAITINEKGSLLVVQISPPDIGVQLTLYNFNRQLTINIVPDAHCTTNLMDTISLCGVEISNR